jgi:hypothetical protein
VRDALQVVLELARDLGERPLAYSTDLSGFAANANA